MQEMKNNISEAEKIILDYLNEKIQDKLSSIEFIKKDIQFEIDKIVDKFNQLVEFEKKYKSELLEIYPEYIDRFDEGMFLSMPLNNLRMEYDFASKAKEISQSNFRNMSHDFLYKKYSDQYKKFNFNIENNEMIFTYSQLSDETNINTNSIKIRLKQLIDKGYISCRKVMGGIAYKLLKETKWQQ